MRVSLQAIKSSFGNYFSRVGELYKETPPAKNEGIVGLTIRTARSTPRMFFAPITALFTQNKELQQNKEPSDTITTLKGFVRPTTRTARSAPAESGVYMHPLDIIP